MMSCHYTEIKNTNINFCRWEKLKKSYSTGCQDDIINHILSELEKLYQINITVLVGVLEQFIWSLSITAHCVILPHLSNNNIRE